MHPLSSFTYFKGCKKLTFNGKSLIWDMHSESSVFSAFEPNMICVPVSEFKLVIAFQDMSREDKKKQEIRSLLDLSQVK